MALFELLGPCQHAGLDRRRLLRKRVGARRQWGKRLRHELAQLSMIQIAGRRDDHVRRDICAGEVVSQRVFGERLDGLLRSEDWPSERMSFPKVLREQLV